MMIMRVLAISALVVGSLAARDVGRAAAAAQPPHRPLQQEDQREERSTTRPSGTGTGDVGADHLGGHPNPACGTCTDADSGAGCSVDEIEQCVCAADSFCCDTQWDVTCVTLVQTVCGRQDCFVDPAHECAGTCGTAHYVQGCSVPEIESCVCDADPYCCNTEWDNFCVDKAFNSPCYTDCDCHGENYFGGATLPSYWMYLGMDNDVNSTHLGFNVAAGKWCYDYSNTCVKWGEWNGQCNDDLFECAGDHTNGHGSEQMKVLAEMEAMGDRRHYGCPDCAHDACPSGEDRASYNGPIFTDCECDEHFIGDHLVENGYWFNAAQDAGLDAHFIAYFDGQWYNHEVPTCVAMGSYSGACPDDMLVCAGGNTFGSAGEQMEALVAAADNVSGSHPACP